MQGSRFDFISLHAPLRQLIHQARKRLKQAGGGAGSRRKILHLAYQSWYCWLERCRRHFYVRVVCRPVWCTAPFENWDWQIPSDPRGIRPDNCLGFRRVTRHDLLVVYRLLLYGRRISPEEFACATLLGGG